MGGSHCPVLHVTASIRGCEGPEQIRTKVINTFIRHLRQVWGPECPPVPSTLGHLGGNPRNSSRALSCLPASHVLPTALRGQRRWPPSPCFLGRPRGTTSLKVTELAGCSTGCHPGSPILGSQPLLISFRSRHRMHARRAPQENMEVNSEPTAETGAGWATFYQHSWPGLG